jgi:preprotein translocase subunit SecA
MNDEDVAETVEDMRHSVVTDLVAKYIPANSYPEQWDVAGLDFAVRDVLTLALPIEDWAKEEGIGSEEVTQRVIQRADEWMASKSAQYGPELMRYVEKSVLLQTLDHLWREHIAMLDHLRQVVGLRGYGQRDPLNEYKSEAFQLFAALLGRLREIVTSQLMRVEIVTSPPPMEELPPMEAHHIDASTGEDEMANAGAAIGLRPSPAIAGDVAVAERDPNDASTWGKVGRNENCPCGSGKKYKHCHGRFA